MKAYRWMGRTIRLMTSGTIEKVRRIVVLPGSMQKKVLKRANATLASSEKNPQCNCAVGQAGQAY